MMPEDRAARVAWQLLGGQASIEWFEGELERQTHPAWDRAVRLIADAIREAVREVSREIRLEAPAFQEPYPWPT